MYLDSEAFTGRPVAETKEGCVTMQGRILRVCCPNAMEVGRAVPGAARVPVCQRNLSPSVLCYVHRRARDGAPYHSRSSHDLGNTPSRCAPAHPSVEAILAPTGQ